jgi:hypothetical protein
MKIKCFLLTVHFEQIDTRTYLFFNLHNALECVNYIKRTKPSLRINLIRKELTREQCEVVLSTGQLPT